jgi:hypothetical protein
MCYTNRYIVDGHPAGVIVMMWLWISSWFWIVVKKPRYMIVGILAIATSILIVGYELQVKKIGKEVSESNGQPAYQLYILAPYRAAVVIVGLSVAYFWYVAFVVITARPPQLTDCAGRFSHTQSRKDSFSERTWARRFTYCPCIIPS